MKWGQDNPDPAYPISNELSDLFLKGLAMKHSALLVAMIAALGLTACAGGVYEDGLGTSGGIFEEEETSGVFEEEETSGVFEEEAETGVLEEEEAGFGAGILE
jgi:hypothetical protein